MRSTGPCSASPSPGSSARRRIGESSTSSGTGCWRCPGGRTEPRPGPALWLQVRDVAAEHARLADRRGDGHPAAPARGVGAGRDVDRGPGRRRASCWSRSRTTTRSAGTSDEAGGPRPGDAEPATEDWAGRTRRTAVRSARGDDEGMRRPAPPVLLCALVLLAGCSSGATMTSATTTSAAPSGCRDAPRRRSSPQPPRPRAPSSRRPRHWRPWTQRGRVAQLFLVGVRLDDLASGDALAQDGVGGLFMAGRSEAPATELAATAQRWQALARRTGPVGRGRSGGWRRPDLEGPGLHPPAAGRGPGRSAARRAVGARRPPGRRAGDPRA